MGRVWMFYGTTNYVELITDGVFVTPFGGENW